MQQVTTAQFEGQPLSIIDHNGQKWLTAEQIGLALGYDKANARNGVSKLYNRHKDEFTGADTAIINGFGDKTSPNQRGGNPTTRIFSASGCNLLSFFSNTPRAKLFRAWAKTALTEQRQTEPGLPANHNRLNNLENAVNQLASHQERTAEHMAALVQISAQQAHKLDVTARYIGLLEINQKGKVKVTRQKEAQALALRAQGMSMSDIGRLLRISPASVNLIVNGKYPWAQSEATEPTPSLEEALQQLIDNEGEKVAAVLQKMAERQQGGDQ